MESGKRATLQQLVTGALSSVEAGVVGPALGKGEGELPRQVLGEEGQVVPDQLLLKSNVGGDDNDLTVMESGLPCRRDEVGEALARSGGSLGEQGLTFAERVGTSPSQFELGFAEYVAGLVPGK